MKRLSKRTWITFLFLSALLAVNNVYSTLLTGWGDGGSIVAVILCLIFLGKSDRSIINCNLGQTMASAGGSVGFTVAILAAIYYTRPDWQPDLFFLSLLILSVSAMGVTLAIPVRRYSVHWFFPSAVACATILRAVSSEDSALRKRASKVMGGFAVASALLTFPSKVALAPQGGALFTHWEMTKKLVLSLDPLYYGIGAIIGPRIGASMLLGGLFNLYYLQPWLAPQGAAAGDYTRWTAVGLMTLPALTSMLFTLLLKSRAPLPPGFQPRKDLPGDALTKMQCALLSAIYLISIALGGYCLKREFQIGYSYFLAAATLSAPLCLSLGKVASVTDINPVRLLGVILLFFFSLFHTFSPVALLALGICGAALAAVSVDLFYDLRTGYLVNADPKRQILFQYIGVVPASFISVYFLHLLATQFGFGEGTFFPAPGAVLWATMAEGFADGEAFPAGVWNACALGSVFGIALSLLEHWKMTKAFAPSPFALGIALLLPFDTSSAIFLGAVLRWAAIILTPRAGGVTRERIEEDAFQAGAAIFASSALTGVLVVILISAGLFYAP